MYAQSGLVQPTKVAEFISRWHGNPASERAGAQPFFLDLCDLLGVDRPGSDPNNYCFERGANRTGAKHGWADVWKRGCFAWENKRPGKDLGEALKQLMTYALALDNPPLLVVSDREIIRIHTHFTGTPSEAHVIYIRDIGSVENLQILRWVFTDPEKFRPQRTVRDITAEAAGRFAEIARTLTAKGYAPQKVAHFLIQCLFCMFAEDVGLLPENRFLHIVEKSAGTPEKLAARLGDLFARMRTGGEHWDEEIHWFNGGLFETIEPIPLDADEAASLCEAARMNWSHIEPSIFGTLFERGLDPEARAQLGAIYTDPDTIRKIIDPVIVEPLLEAWEATKAEIIEKLADARNTLLALQRTADARLTRSLKGRKPLQESGHNLFQPLQRELAKQIEAQKGKVTKAEKEATRRFHAFINRLKDFHVLDPACGSGNFLYLALRALKDLEHRVNLDAEALGLHRQLMIETSPANVMGIEINPYAAELTRVTIWIGEIQWMLAHGYEIRRNPILAKLDHIECRDAIVGPDGADAIWPTADCIVGNPPFVGNKRMLSRLGEDYTNRLRTLFNRRLPGGVELVAYWFERARAQIEAGKCQGAGLVATQAIRKGANRTVLDRIVASMPIYHAWSDEPWVNEGTAIRVSLVAFGHGASTRLDGQVVARINADLTCGSGGLDLTTASVLRENVGAAFQGPVKVGAFDIPGDIAREWLAHPNPNRRPSSDVLRPWANGQHLAGRPSDTWIIDFGTDMSETEAAMYELPFAHVQQRVKPMREAGRRESRKRYWWRHGETVPAMRRTMAGLSRYIATPRVSKHRFFVWLPVTVLPDSRLYTICREDDCSFGVLSSRMHEVWALANASRHGVGNDPTYNARNCFETFPFPAGMTPEDTAAGPLHAPLAKAIAAAALRLDQARENWINPIEWTERVPEVVSGFPDRIVPKSGYEAELKKRTLTNLYNKRPVWLEKAHQQLDTTVAAAYGWTDYTPAMPDDEILRRLLALNLEYSRAEH